MPCIISTDFKMILAREIIEENPTQVIRDITLLSPHIQPKKKKVTLLSVFIERSGWLTDLALAESK